MAYLLTIREINSFVRYGSGVLYSRAVNMPLAAAVSGPSSRLLLVNSDVRRSYIHDRSLDIREFDCLLQVIPCRNSVSVSFKLLNDFITAPLHTWELLDTIFAPQLPDTQLLERQFLVSMGTRAALISTGESIFTLIGSPPTSVCSAFLLIPHGSLTSLSAILDQALRPVRVTGLPPTEFTWVNGICFINTGSFIYALTGRIDELESNRDRTVFSHFTTLPAPSHIRSVPDKFYTVARTPAGSIFAFDLTFNNNAWYEVVFPNVAGLYQL